MLVKKIAKTKKPRKTISGNSAFIWEIEYPSFIDNGILPLVHIEEAELERLIKVLPFFISHGGKIASEIKCRTDKK